MKKLAITVLALLSPLASAEIVLEKVMGGLDKPTCFVVPKDDNDFFYLLEKPGRIRLYDTKKKELVAEPFLDITSQIKIKMNEQGLLGMVFSPDYATDGRFYLNYTDLNGDTVISRFKKEDDTFNEEILLQFKQDFRNHNGGWIGFGPDGMLYIATGDGGAGNDPKQRAQDEHSFLGKLLRIDVSGDKGYTIPKGNMETTGKPEILAKGLRNPWRCAWEGNLLYIADVGQNAYEEVNVLHKDKLQGANFGWRLREGFHKTPKKNVGGEKPENAIEPVIEYPRNEGVSITGGYVYNGKIKSIQGHYFYADYATAKIWSFKYGENEITDKKDWTDSMTFNGKKIPLICSFGIDNKKDMYIISHQGTVYKIVEKE